MNQPVKPTDATEQESTHVHSSIASALARAQTQMGKALKSANNPHFKSKYADLSSVVDACLPALNANGIAVIQPTTDEDGRHFVETILVHGESGETLKCRVPLIVQKNDMQGYGSAVTYARRYGLMSMAGIAPEDDDGDAAVKAKPDAFVGQTEAFRRAVEDAKRAIAGETSLESLGAFWSDLQKRSNSVAANSEVIAAKDERKKKLAPILDDEIPY